MAAVVGQGAETGVGAKGDKSWAEQAQCLCAQYREEDRRRTPEVVQRRCRRRDLLFQVALPSVMVLQPLLFGHRALARHTSVPPRTFRAVRVFFRLCSMVGVRLCVDAGWLCRASIPEQKLLPASSWLSLQGSCLSVGLTFFMGQTLALMGQFVRSSIYVALELTMRINGGAWAMRVAALRWPLATYYARCTRVASLGLWVRVLVLLYL